MLGGGTRQQHPPTVDIGCHVAANGVTRERVRSDQRPYSGDDRRELLGTMGPVALGIGVVVAGGFLSCSGVITNTMNTSEKSLVRPQEVILSGKNWEKASRSLRVITDSDAVIFTNLQSYYCLFPEIRNHGDVHAHQFVMSGEDVIGRSFRVRNAPRRSRPEDHPTVGGVSGIRRMRTRPHGVHNRLQPVRPGQVAARIRASPIRSWRPGARGSISS